MKISRKDGSICEVTFEDEVGKSAFRHTSAHILAQAVKRLYPETKCAIGPAIADGFVVNEGDGAFYGPKIDFHLEDSIGRTWQCGTIQLDFQLPQRFEAEYIGQDGEKHRPIMIHRVVFGSLERFVGILIEHYEGKFPLWLSPVQVKILSISEKYVGYAETVQKELKQAEVRCETDHRCEKIGYKIRQARLERASYIVVVGEKDAIGSDI